MDIIEIYSSDSDDDLEIVYDGDKIDKWGNLSKSFLSENNESSSENNDERVMDSSSDLGTASLSKVSGASMVSNIRSNEMDVATHKYLSGPIDVTDMKFPVLHRKRRILPSSFMTSLSKPILRPISGPCRESIADILHKEHGGVAHDGELELTSDVKDGTDLPENVHNGVSKRDFLSPVSSINVPKSSSSMKVGSQNFQTGKFCSSTRPDLDYRVDYRTKMNGETGASENCGRVLPSSFVGGTATHALTRFQRPPNLQENFHTMPKASMENKDGKHIHQNTIAYRMMPPSLYGKSVNILQRPDSSDGPKHLGIGDNRHTEHDEMHIYQEALQNLAQPTLEDDLPEGLLSVPLLKHQRIALAWMVQKEKSTHCSGGILADDQGLGKTISMIALIQKQMAQQSKFTFADSNYVKSEALNLDDDDGITELNTAKKLTRDNDHRHVSLASSSLQTSCNSRPGTGTLVVCPASILRQWARELDEKIPDSSKLSVLIYHGGARTKDPNELAKYHVVLTTYSIVANEVSKQLTADDDEVEQKNLDKYGMYSEFESNIKRKRTSNRQKKNKKKGKGLKDSQFDFGSRPLAKVRWFRVILDEAQTIKNHRTQVARACCGLRAKRRWCLSGTPLQNAIDDLYSYFCFLKYEPYDVYSTFLDSIKYQISKDPSSGYRKVQAVLKVVLLRRTKGTLIDGEPILELPPKTINLEKIDFSQKEREFYLALEADSREQFKKYADAGTLEQNYASILVLLLRLRQACDHPLLVSGFRSDTIQNNSLHMAKQLPREMLINLLNHLEGSLSVCGVCSDPPEDAVIAMCGHVFCYQCISVHLTSDDNSCPVTGCSEVLGTDIVFSRLTLKSCTSDVFDDEASISSSFNGESITDSGYISSKVKVALNILKSISSPKSTKLNPKLSEKVIVFSQWTSMLDLLEISISKHCIQYRRLDGTMSLLSRDKAVKDFNTDAEVTVMLMSLKAGSLGLNMIAACHVILLDLWWNPTVEDQAIDRAHRIGQTRPVTVFRLTIKDTVEDRIIALQVTNMFNHDAAKIQEIVECKASPLDTKAAIPVDQQRRHREQEQEQEQLHSKMENLNQDHVIGFPVSSVAHAAEDLPGNPSSYSCSSSHRKHRKDLIAEWMNKLGEKAEGIREHVALGSNISDTMKGKLSMGARILQAGGVERVFRRAFAVGEGEKLLKAFQCYLSTTAGPVSGMLFISNEKVAFRSNRSLKLTSAKGCLVKVPYKVLIPLRKINGAIQSENKSKPSEKYIQVVTEDDFEFWFMGFVSCERSFKYLQQAISAASQ
ncbi:helicase-like transcription factor CHR28 [Canna indica]|uniref:Helicase-like transcription factor CHR28 n=1 Tax=Canna indica TaxID=4628 RepID=A0AAQ3K0L2_9LILI|nr:helicase-like transcription factor CHR28 [Canna indica]